MIENNTDDVREILMNGMEGLRKHLELSRKQNEMPYDEVFRVLNDIGVDLTMEKILADYEEIKDTKELCDRYYEQYEELLEKPQKTDWVNGDIIDRLVGRIVKENYTAAETGDAYLIAEMIMDYEHGKLKLTQPVIEDFYRALILHAKTKKTSRLSEIDDYYDVGYFAAVMIKHCHNRNFAFRNLIKEFFRLYEDADRKMLPSAYQEVQEEKKKKK